MVLAPCALTCLRVGARMATHVMGVTDRMSSLCRNIQDFLLERAIPNKKEIACFFEEAEQSPPVPRRRLGVHVQKIVP